MSWGRVRAAAGALAPAPHPHPVLLEEELASHTFAGSLESKSGSLCGAAKPSFHRGRVSRSEGQGPLEELGNCTGARFLTRKALVLVLSRPSGCFRKALGPAGAAVSRRPSDACSADRRRAGVRTWPSRSRPPGAEVSLFSPALFLLLHLLSGSGKWYCFST